MYIELYESKYQEDICDLWNRIAVKQGFVPAEGKTFEMLLTKHPYFGNDLAFLLLEKRKVVGFICGCVGDELPRGKVRGYITCLLLEEGIEQRYVAQLLDKLGEAFRRKGREAMACHFFNPMRVPWIMPETNGAIHNNAPGIPVDLPLYEDMQAYGFETITKECAMYLELAQFCIPQKILEKEKKAEQEGYHVEWYNKEIHTNLISMVDAFGNPQWSEEIPYAAEHINMLVATYGNEVVGFAGPVYPEETNRGYFAGIGVSQHHENHGLGTLLFYKLCEAEKEEGAQYMSLFTGVENPARGIYKGAGFVEKRIFAVMVKAL